MGEQLTYHYGDKTILELRNLQENGHLNLEPGFQRKSVWNLNDRRKLIQSVFENMPAPSIFLYRRVQNGQPIYDVLDGKQRLESIFMFSKVTPFRRSGYAFRFQFPDDEMAYWYEWRDIERFQLSAPFLTYKIQTVEVSGDFADICELFVRINSTGKALTSSEKRHARFYTSPLLKEAEKLAKRHGRFFQEQQILRGGQIDRMKDVELVSEILASLVAGGPIHKKQAVDRAVGNESINAKTLSKVIKEFGETIGDIKRVFSDIRTTRFRNTSEFYTLFMIVWELRQQRSILNDRSRNRQASEILKRFSDGVDMVRERQRLAQGAKPNQRLFADYLLLVQQSTDALSQRKRRAEIIRNLIGGLFEKKDERRTFTSEQRRVLWNTEEKKKCSICGVSLDWTNFHVDHVVAHSRGGKTQLGNAALACISCNTSKGARRHRSHGR